MISYKPFFETIKRKNITTYRLMKTYKVSSSLIDKLKHNRSVTTKTLNDLCMLLNCELNDICVYINDKNEEPFYTDNINTEW